MMRHFILFPLLYHVSFALGMYISPIIVLIPPGEVIYPTYPQLAGRSRTLFRFDPLLELYPSRERS